MYLLRNARQAFYNIPTYKSYLIAETSLREQAQVDAHLLRQLAPAAVHTPSLRTTDSLIAFPSTPAARLPEDVACCSRVFTRGRQKGREADNKCSARAAPGRFRVARDDRRLALFDRRLGKYLTR